MFAKLSPSIAMGLLAAIHAVEGYLPTIIPPPPGNATVIVSSWPVWDKPLYLNWDDFRTNGCPKFVGDWYVQPGSEDTEASALVVRCTPKVFNDTVPIKPDADKLNAWPGFKPKPKPKTECCFPSIGYVSLQPAPNGPAPLYVWAPFKKLSGDYSFPSETPPVVI